MASYRTKPDDQAMTAFPLNSMPYVDPRDNNNNVSQTQDGKKPVPSTKPALIFFPSQPCEEEWNYLLSFTKGGVGLTGIAALGLNGPVLEKMDVSESEGYYVFRVSLPTVSREDFTCDCEPSGKILIKGVTTTADKVVYKSHLKFEMQPQQTYAPGPFSITFKLPGPVEPRYLSAHLGMDGVFECSVKKKM